MPGPLSMLNIRNLTVIGHIWTNQTREDHIESFSKLQEFPKENIFSICKEYFQQTNIVSDGRFTVTISLELNLSQLGDSNLNRLQYLERNLTFNLKQYEDFMNEYISLNNITLLKDQSDDSPYFLPHQCVIKETSTISSLRIVFYGSSKTLSSLFG